MDNKDIDFASYIKNNNPELFSIIESDPQKKKCIDETNKVYNFFIEKAKHSDIGYGYIFIILFCILFGDNKLSFKENFLDNTELTEEFKSDLKIAYEQIPKYIKDYLYHLLDGIGGENN